MKKKICVLLTGGTICSVPDSNEKNRSDATAVRTILTDFYSNETDSPFSKDVDFDIKTLSPDILSENMTVGAWNEILHIFKNEIVFDDYVGIIILHGTDTLAYTASFLSLVLAGINIPVCMVSSQLRLGRHINGKWQKDEKANGYANFRASVELIMNGIAPNVYAVYRNEKNCNHEPDELLVHYGAHLLQCPNHSNNFHSYDEMPIPDASNATLSGTPFETDGRYFEKIESLCDKILMVMPYTNLRYSAISLDGIRAIIHGTYHSESVCIGRLKDKSAHKNGKISASDILDSDRPFSILTLIDACKKRDIPLFLAPCDKESFAYGTTSDALAFGALSIPNTTLELAYAKLIIGCSLGKKGPELIKFLNTGINHEFIYKKRTK